MEEKKEVFVLVTMSNKAFYSNSNTYIWFEDFSSTEKQLKNNAQMFNTIGDAMKVAAEINKALGTTLYKVVSYYL